MAKLKGQLFARLALDYADHPKIVSLSDAAFRAHIGMILYARTYETDGRIPRRLAETRWGTESVSELLTNDPDAPSLVERPNGDYLLYGYADMQETRDEIAERRQVNRRNGQKGGRPPKTQSVSESVSDSGSETKAETETETDLSSTKRGGGRKRPSRPLPDGWAPTASHRQKAASERIDLDKEAEKFRDNAVAHDRRYANWDRAFSNWLSKDWVSKLPDQSDIPSFWRDQ